ncbi:META domain-containing protein [Lacinutrix sp. 5H-3-7-4]|uniref:META domain-containing protein n=1 Tax=Lacinutrix sp. (strain 5H-3-7-4) TaxID=983544 RepID=UPI00020A3C0C|nr:META domain-containing protein [Lacinutrix sp. 5H-3-7-4]AEH01023.1 protein of unknown function DUF306 Meta and HslJ [Lacinutrix sp. 5H-3-7-4]
MKTITMLFFTIILNACGANQAASNFTNNNKAPQNILSGEFVVLSIDANNIEQKLTINFNNESNRVSGFSGCNNFSGSYSIINNAIEFSTIASTKKMCADNANNLVERQLLNHLNKVNSFNIENNTLTLYFNETELLSAIKKTEEKTIQEDIKIEYKTQSRGSFNAIVLKNETISIQKGHNTVAKTKAYSSKDWQTALQLIENLNLKALSNLQPPTKAHQYDGAAMANFSVTKNGDTYNVPVFDAGKPNKEIEPLVTLLLKIANQSEEKN